ncbi:MAG: LysR substrate-binding domain-containing protein [Pseudomonadota bacterium]
MGLGREAAQNRLRLACFYTISAFTLPRLLSALNTSVPEIDVTLIEGDQSRLQAALDAGEAELALMYDENVADHLIKELMIERDPYVLLPEDHPLAAKESISAEDLRDVPMVLLNTPPSPGYFLSLLRDQGVEPRIAWQSAAIETVRSMVGNGLGYALLASRPESCSTYGGRRVAVRPLSWKARPSRVVLVRRRGATLSAGAERFAALCRALQAEDLH